MSSVRATTQPTRPTTVSYASTVDTHPPRANASGATLPAVAPALARIDPSVIARTHQIDGLPTTQWDTTRCGGASTVAIVALSGPSYLTALARAVECTLVDRLTAFNAHVAAVTSDVHDHAARKRVLVELSRHIASYGLTFRSAMGQLDIVHDEAAPITPAPRPVQRVQWLRWHRQEKGTLVRMAVERKQIDLAAAATLLTVAQRAHREDALFAMVRDALSWEIDKTRTTRIALDREGATSPEPLQALADQVVLAARNSERGVNAYYLEALLRAAGLSTTMPKREGGAAFAESAALVRPGELLLLAGSAHMVAFGRDDHGMCYLYDSEGLFGDARKPTLRTLGTRPDLSPESDVGRAYRGFVSLLKVARHAPRLPTAARSSSPWTSAA